MMIKWGKKERKIRNEMKKWNEKWRKNDDEKWMIKDEKKRKMKRQRF